MRTLPWHDHEANKPLSLFFGMGGYMSGELHGQIDIDAATAEDPTPSLVVERKAFLDLDNYRTYAAVDVVSFEGKPIGLVRHAGKDGDDHRDRFVTDEDGYNRAYRHVMRWFREPFYAENRTFPDADVEDLERFYGRLIGADGSLARDRMPTTEQAASGLRIAYGHLEHAHKTFVETGDGPANFGNPSYRRVMAEAQMAPLLADGWERVAVADIMTKDGGWMAGVVATRSGFTFVGLETIGPDLTWPLKTYATWKSPRDKDKSLEDEWADLMRQVAERRDAEAATAPDAPSP